jgi:TRAP-type C4-dicarboxylate transport system substrate-binding protein
MTIKRGHLLWILALGAAGLVARPSDSAELKIATVAPEQSSWMQDMRRAAAEIRKETGGTVVLRLYGGGIQGNDARILRKIRIGQLHGATFTTSGLATACPDIAVYGLPLLFQSFAEVAFVRSKIDARLIECLGGGGYEVLGISGTGFARLMSSQPIARLRDARGRKIWVPDGDTTSLMTMRELGLAPVVLPISDVMTGLQTGLLDAIAAPPTGALILQWNTKLGFLTDLPLAYNAGYLVVDGRAFAALTPSERATVRAVLGTAYRRFDELVLTEDARAARALITSGLTPVVPDAADRAEWSARVERTYAEFVRAGLISQSILDEVRRLLATYRGQTAGSAAAMARPSGSAVPAARLATVQIQAESAR